MSMIRLKHSLLASLALGCAFTAPAFAQATDAIPAATAPDSGLYASYSFNSSWSSVSLSVCGSVPGSGGCYGGGTMGTFGHVGALIEGNPHVDTPTNTVTRLIYVVDQAAGAGTAVQLVVYKLTEAINAPFATITVSKVRTVDLPQLTGGAGVQTYLGANGKFLFVATNASTHAVKVAKVGYAATTVGGFSPAINVSSITTDHYGFVTVTFGGVSGSDGFYTFDPNGSLQGDGGGAEVLLNTQDGLSTSRVLATTSAVPAVRYGIKFDKPKK